MCHHIFLHLPDMKCTKRHFWVLHDQMIFPENGANGFHSVQNKCYQPIWLSLKTKTVLVYIKMDYLIRSRS